MFFKGGIILLLAISVLCLVFSLELKQKNYYTLASHEMNVKLCAQRLDTMGTAPKIMFIGGSGCGFGIDSRIIASHFNMPVVNTGTHASIGLRLQMEVFKKYINKGDIIVVIPEHSNYSGLFYLGGDQTILRILNSYPEACSSCPIWQKLYISQFIPKYFQEAVTTKPDEPVNGPYSIKYLNEYGDVTAYEQRDSSQTIVAYSKVKKRYNPLVKRYISDYKKYSEERGATFILLPPALAHSSYVNNEEFIDDVYSKFNNTESQLFIDRPQACSFPDSLYYDTPYHFTTAGVKLRSETLVKQIEQSISR